MTFVTWKLEHTPFANNTYDSDDTVTLTDFYDPIMSVKLGTAKDTFSFKVTNFNDNFNDYFNVKDKIVLSRVINSDTVTTDDIKMVGVCKDIPEEHSSGQNLIRVEGVNYSETITNGIFFGDVENETIPQAIKHGIDFVSGTTPNFKVVWHPDNPDVKQDLTAFPSITIDTHFWYKPLRDLIEKYSTNQETTDGHYYWYVNNNNYFIWRPMKSGIKEGYEFNKTTDTFKSIKVSKDISGIRNYIIMKGGFDPQGNQIQRTVPDFVSIAKNGMRFYVHISKTNKAEELIKSDLDNSYGKDIGDNSYPSLPYTTPWISAATNAVVVCTTKSDYVTAIREHIKALLNAEGQEMLELYRYGKLKIDLVFDVGSKNSWQLGDNINCTIPNIRELPFVMRIKEIQYTTTTDTFTLEEDKGTLGE